MKKKSPLIEREQQKNFQMMLSPFHFDKGVGFFSIRVYTFNIFEFCFVSILGVFWELYADLIIWFSKTTKLLTQVCIFWKSHFRKELASVNEWHINKKDRRHVLRYNKCQYWTIKYFVISTNLTACSCHVTYAF